MLAHQCFAGGPRGHRQLRHRRWLAAAGGLLLLVTIRSAAWTAPLPGDALASFALPDPGRGVVCWQPGQVTILSFCALWCDTWREQRRRLEAVGTSARGLPVRFLTVSVDGRWSERWRHPGDAVLQLGVNGGRVAAQRPGAYPRSSQPSVAFPGGGGILLDVGGRLCARMGIQTVPYTVVTDARGRVRYAARGILRTETLSRAIREAVAGAETRSGVVYLTFDDFPSASGDDELLDLLRAHGVPATFFCLGRKISADRDTVRRAAREGHALQVQHMDGSLHSDQAVDPYDYRRPGEEEIVRRVVSAARSGSVILLHAGVPETRAALPHVIAALRRRGLSFGLLR